MRNIISHFMHSKMQWYLKIPAPEFLPIILMKNIFFPEMTCSFGAASRVTDIDPPLSSFHFFSLFDFTISFFSLHSVLSLSLCLEPFGDHAHENHQRVMSNILRPLRRSFNFFRGKIKCPGIKNL